MTRINVNILDVGRRILSVTNHTNEGGCTSMSCWMSWSSHGPLQKTRPYTLYIIQCLHAITSRVLLGKPSNVESSRITSQRTRLSSIVIEVAEANIRIGEGRSSMTERSNNRVNIPQTGRQSFSHQYHFLAPFKQFAFVWRKLTSTAWRTTMRPL